MVLSKKYPIVRSVVLIMLNILDVLLTYYALSQDSGFYESNPIGRYLIGLGWGYAIFIKMFCVAFVVTALMCLSGCGHTRPANWALNTLLILYTVVVANNTYLLIFT